MIFELIVLLYFYNNITFIVKICFEIYITTNYILIALKKLYSIYMIYLFKTILSENIISGEINDIITL